MKTIQAKITAPKGFQAAGVKAGIKKSGKEDLAVIYSDVPANIAGVFTTNLMAAAPVQVSKQVVQQGKAQAIVVNSGCANACTGEQGLADAKAMTELTAKALKLSADAVAVASTGVIGVNLPMDKIAQGIEKAVSALSYDGHDKAMQAILTTDLVAKEQAYELSLGGKTVRLAGMAKGSGMIHPNMATMLCFITTDAQIAPEILQQALKEAVKVSFNMVTVDGDTSTNDMVLVLANGLAENEVITSTEQADYDAFAKALTALCIDLAKKVARDGEGATKFLEVQVKGAKDFAEGKTVAMSIAKSPLVKTAFFGEDPNWGRIVCAAGYAGVSFDPNVLSLELGGLKIVEKGQGIAVDEKALKKVMAQPDIVLTLDLQQGDTAVTAWTCDFSYEYVKINGEYHT